MKRLIVFCIAFCSLSVFARTIVVSNMEELNSANTSARPGDVIILTNGTWKNVVIKLNCSGTENLPITVKAQTPGKVIISGVSQLRLGGNYTIVEGLLFTNGYSPSHEVIDFKINNKELANHCRITNCIINDFNKPKRMADDNWVSFSGKNNRVDHCSFINKKNMGVLLAVLLDDDRSRENFHSIDHNYFGLRLPLASNGGETIRVGLSQHCQFNSNTQIKDNVFEHCDGEAEVISIKSCSNVVSNNVFKECQGSVVLRHGNYNTVTNNIFLGNGKEGTGGVRIINKGQWVINNLFYKCRGESFRAPLVIMNGIPNSPANRYVQVTDAVVMNNSFVDCAPMSFGEGSDSERTLSPSHVLFAGNIFYNSHDSSLYQAWDDISGIQFIRNEISNDFKQKPVQGFERISFRIQKFDLISLPVEGEKNDNHILDSLTRIGKERLPKLTGTIGFSDLNFISKMQATTYTDCGAKWFKNTIAFSKPVQVNCKTAADIYELLLTPGDNIAINLTGNEYTFDSAITIRGEVQFSSSKKTIHFASTEELPSLFLLKGKANLVLQNLNVSAKNLKTNTLVATDTFGSSEHCNLRIENSCFSNLSLCDNFFYASKSTLTDSIIIRNCTLTDLKNGFILSNEKDNKGYYNVEKIKIINNQFINGEGILLNLYRGGSDESTLGPDLFFANNRISQYNSGDSNAIILLNGIQKTMILGNTFSDCNTSATLIQYTDLSRAKHSLYHNQILHSGLVQKNNFVIDNGNSIQ